MAKKTCVKIKPVVPGTETHNFRLKENIKDVFKEHSHLNEYLGKEELLNCTKSISSVRKEIAKRYFKTVGQKIQRTATPIRDAVVVIEENTTMEQLKEFSARLKSDFGITVLQIAIHKDEGHINRKTGKLEKNLHAHVVCDFTDQVTGKSLKLGKQDMADIQTLASEVLNMERGKHGTKGGLDIFQYKIAKKDEELREMDKEMASKIHILKSVKEIENEIKDVPHGRTDGAGKQHYFSFFDRLELWFGNFVKLKQYTHRKTGEFLETAFALFDKIEKKVNIKSNQPNITQAQQNRSRQIGMQKLKGIKM